MKYPINEVFDTIQGEGSLTGTPATFIRFQGCDVGCAWCDTQHSWPLNESDIIPIPEMLAKVEPSKKHAVMSASEILSELLTRAPRHVVITGGEPCVHDLIGLCLALEATGKTVQIETSGTALVRVSPGAWVTLSAKLGMAGGLPVMRSSISRANEIKHPVGKLSDITKLLALVVPYATTKMIYLQPLSLNKTATSLCIEAAAKYDFKVSIQTHKLIGVR